MPAHLQETGSGFMAVASPSDPLQILQPHQAISLHPPADCVLRMVRGRVWVTTGTGPGLPGQVDAGDVVLGAGQHLALPAGAHVVVENWPLEPGEVVRFEVVDESPHLKRLGSLHAPHPIASRPL